MLRLNHTSIRNEKQRQACTDSQCGFCGCVTLWLYRMHDQSPLWLCRIIKALQIIVLLLQAWLLEIYLFCKMWSEAAYKKSKLNLPKHYQAKRLETLHWVTFSPGVDRFIEQANTFHLTIKFKVEISENEITFLDTMVFKVVRFLEKSILDIKTHYKPTKTFQYTHFSTCYPPGVKRGFIKSEPIRTNSSKTTFEELKSALQTSNDSSKHAVILSKEIYRKVPVRSHLWFKTIGRDTIDFCHYIPPYGKETQIVIENWSLIENRPLVKTIF